MTFRGGRRFRSLRSVRSWRSFPALLPDGSLPYTFDDANRVTADSTGGTYSADADGRLTSRPGQRLVWDSLGRLTRVLPPTGAGTLATYTYDPLDRLLVADDGTIRTRFRYVG